MPADPAELARRLREWIELVAAVHRFHKVTVPDANMVGRMDIASAKEIASALEALPTQENPSGVLWQCETIAQRVDRLLREAKEAAVQDGQLELAGRIRELQQWARGDKAADALAVENAALQQRVEELEAQLKVARRVEADGKVDFDWGVLSTIDQQEQRIESLEAQLASRPGEAWQEKQQAYAAIAFEVRDISRRIGPAAAWDRVRSELDALAHKYEHWSALAPTPAALPQQHETPSPPSG